VPDRAIVFLDGNNWYHGLRDRLNLPDLLKLDYAAVSRKLVGPREWIGTRYYIGQVRQRGNMKLYANQRRFLASLTAADNRISYHLGRLERRKVPNEAAKELRRYLKQLDMRIDRRIFHELMALADKHWEVTVTVEKAVDVHLAVDMVTMAERDEYDAAYLLSADGDFTPAVKAVRSLGKNVYAATPLFGAELAAVVNAFIRLDSVWFADCYRR
jgi:uncharacterized LabA/DUF88 family protein